MNPVTEFFSHFIQPNPHTALLVVLNLIVIESLLSVDNAAVLATMVMDLPAKQRNRALRIGIIFAYIFRGAALVFAGLLIKINWLKLAGGGYLVYLCFDFFYKRITLSSTDNTPQIKRRKRLPGLGYFWSAVAMVELMDLTFSVDNVFAAVAFTKNIYLVCTGVFIGILTMRIVAGYFVKLMEKFPFLDTVAFTVIGILGVRLVVDFFCIYFPDNAICSLLQGKRSEMYFSIITVGIFILPIATSLLFNVPKGKRD